MHNWRRTACLVTLLGATAAIMTSAQTFTTLNSFNNYNGAGPIAGLVQGTNGSLYGTTGGVANGSYGTAFKMTTNGILTAIYYFCSLNECADGFGSQAPLVQATNGIFYGTTCCGGLYGDGTVFKMASDGTVTTLYSFCSQTDCTDGARPFAGLALGSDGNLYGTTIWGGAFIDSCGLNSCGTVFKITPSGTYTVLHSFQNSDGAYPYGTLIQATDGNLYGTTYQGGTNSIGTVFKITTGGDLTTLYNFCTDFRCGGYPMAGLLQASDGNFYGTSAAFGGTVFKLTEAGAAWTLHQFCSESGCPDGEFPDAPLIQATDGYLYGTTSEGGTGGLCGNEGCGTVFRISTTGGLTTLHNFCLQSGCTDGSYPYGALLQDTDGNLFGTTHNGGTSEGCGVGVGCGTVFELAVGLGPFVEPEPASGRVGAPVAILGTALKGTTRVTFNGVPATFKVVSTSQITTTVPSGATTGTVQVVTPSATLSSNVPFRVIP